MGWLSGQRSGSGRGTQRWILTSRHQVLPQHWHPEVASQRGQVGPYAGELLAHFCGLRAEVAEGTQAHDAMGVVSKDVVPGGQQVVCLHQLQGRPQVRGSWPGEEYWGTPRGRGGTRCALAPGSLGLKDWTDSFLRPQTLITGVSVPGTWKSPFGLRVPGKGVGNFLPHSPYFSSRTHQVLLIALCQPPAFPPSGPILLTTARVIALKPQCNSCHSQIKRDVQLPLA